MSPPPPSSWRSAPVLLAAGAALTWLLVTFRHFVLDDSYISYRFADHLARGEGLRWNPGEDPVEGFTSMFWVLGNALGIRLGLEPLHFSRLLAVASALITLAVLLRAGRTRPVALTLAVLAALAASPPYAFSAMHGMETVTTGLWVLLGAVLATRAVRRPSPGSIAAWFLVALLAGVTRPDTAAFFGGAGVVLAAVLLGRGDSRVRVAFLGAAFLAGAAGFAYMAWRRSYFGYWLPNTFYVKLGTGEGLLKERGISYVLEFLRCWGAPYLAGLLLLLARGPRGGRLALLPGVTGVLLFLAYLLTILPEQGLMYRFALPLMPALLWLLLEAADQPLVERLGRVSGPLLVLLAAAWNLQTYPAARRLEEERAPRDRILAGKALAGLDGCMMVADAGALPYFSGWRASDFVGLTSEDVAHQGLSERILRELRPDLIQMGGPVYRPESPWLQQLDLYLQRDGFVAVAAIHKSQGYHHFYFARQRSPLFAEVVQRLRSIEGVAYGDLERLIRSPVQRYRASGIPPLRR